MSLAVRAQALAVGWQRHTVVDAIDVDLPRGATLALVGSNGSGKSTLLRTLAGLVPPIAGRLEVLDAPAGTQPRRVGYLGQFHPQGFALPLRARDVVAMGRYPARRAFGRLRDGDRRLVAAAMERMDVTRLENRALRDLSGGQRQRVYIAQALAWEADLLLLDEPGAGLDVAALDLLAGAVAAERARGAAVVMATHDIRDAAAADLAMLMAGRVVAAGPAAAVITAAAVRETFGLVTTAGLDGMEVPVDAHHCAHDHEA